MTELMECYAHFHHFCFVQRHAADTGATGGTDGSDHERNHGAILEPFAFSDLAADRWRLLAPA